MASFSEHRINNLWKMLLFHCLWNMWLSLHNAWYLVTARPWHPTFSSCCDKTWENRGVVNPFQWYTSDLALPLAITESSHVDLISNPAEANLSGNNNCNGWASGFQKIRTGSHWKDKVAFHWNCNNIIVVISIWKKNAWHSVKVCTVQWIFWIFLMNNPSWKKQRTCSSTNIG